MKKFIRKASVLAAIAIFATMLPSSVFTDNSVTADGNKKEEKNSSAADEEAKKASGKSKIFTNKKNDFNANISKKSNSKKLVSIKKDKYEVNWNLEGVNSVEGVIEIL